MRVSVFGDQSSKIRIQVDGRPKLSRKCAFLYKNVHVWTQNLRWMGFHGKLAVGSIGGQHRKASVF